MVNNFSEDKDVRLVIKIDNRHPVELIDLTKSFIALSSQFNNYIKNTHNIENREARLYVKEIKSGSIILDLIEIATVGVLPFIENINTIVGFADYCKNAINYYLRRDNASDPKFSVKDCTDFSQIVNPVAKDSGAQFNISTTINGDVENYVQISSLEGNAFQNILKKELTKLKLAEVSGEYEKVVMYWDTAKSNIKADAGNKAIIESIDKKSAKVIFDNDDIKERVLKGDENPLKTAYVVDVKIETVHGNIAAYKVMALHETFPIETNN